MMKRIALGLLALAAHVGCGDDTTDPAATTGGGAAGNTGNVGGVGNTGNSGGAGNSGNSGGDGGTGGDGGSGGMGGVPFVEPTPFAVPLSAAGPDQLQSVTAAEADTFLAAGYAATAVGGTRLITVVKFNAAGPVAAFGTGGVATTTAAFVGGNDEIDIATQSDGKIIVSATVANGINPLDRDVAVLRLNADGSPDTDFGENGARAINLNDAILDGGSLTAFDSARSLTVNADDEIFVHAATRRNVALATDTDFAVVKLTADGDIDSDDFGTDGVFRHDIAQVNATPRGIKAFPDGTLIASGYAETPDVGDTVQAVLYKLTTDGELDGTWATNGVFHTAVLAEQTEVYNFAVHGANLVTAGYGRNTGETNDYVSLRFAVATGVRDLTWGGTANGAVVVDPSGTMLGSNARNAIGLPGGETIIIGSTGPNNAPEQDAVFVVLDANGALDTSYGDGIHVLPLGANGNDAFWGGAVSGNTVALVGFKGGGPIAGQTATVNDDAWGVVFEIQ